MRPRGHCCNQLDIVALPSMYHTVHTAFQFKMLYARKGGEGAGTLSGYASHRLMQPRVSWRNKSSDQPPSGGPWWRWLHGVEFASWACSMRSVSVRLISGPIAAQLRVPSRRGISRSWIFEVVRSTTHKAHVIRGLYANKLDSGKPVCVRSVLMVCKNVYRS